MSRLDSFMLLGFLVCTPSMLLAVDEPAPQDSQPPVRAQGPPAPPPKGKWVNISDALVQAIIKSGAAIPWPGQTAGIAADPVSGDIFLVVTNNGVWKSSDRGATYVRVDRSNVTGRAETGFSLDMDPAGKRLMCFMVDGSSAMLLDGGMNVVKSPASNMNFGAVDWTDGQTLIAVRHETKGWGWHSENGGKNWKDFGPGFDCVGVFDEKTFVAVKGRDPGIKRSSDGGETWEKVSNLEPAGRGMRVFKGAGYWTSKKGLLVSKDKGQTWNVQGAAVEMSTGPYFGKDETNIIVAGPDGLLKTTDAGESWRLTAPYPEKMKYEPRGWFGNFAWDPINDILYASVMGQPAYRWEPEK